MTELTRWLRRQAAREGRTVHLEEALLGNRFLAYALYRLRYFFLRYGAESGVHAIRVLLLYRLFSLHQFQAILLITASASLLDSFWWGGLEVMRDGIRRLYRSGSLRRIPHEIARWLRLSGVLAGAAIIAGILLTAWRVRSHRQPFGAADLYILSIFFRLATDLVTRCYHSGIYAIRRVYRPVRAMLGTELAGFAAVLALWPLLGGWSLPAATMVSAAATTAILMHYTGVAYRFVGLSPLRFVVRARRSPLRGSVRHLVAAGLSSVVLNMDSLLVLTLFTRPSRANPTPLFVLFFVLSPTIRAGSKWAQLFYFDLKRLEIKLFNNIRRRFEKAILRLAFPLGFVWWGLASLIGTAVYQRSLREFYLLMIPFFVFRSLLAVRLVQAFAEQGYERVLETGVLCLVGFLAANLLLHHDQEKILCVALVTFLAFVLLNLPFRWQRAKQEVSGREVLWLSEWLARLRQVRNPVRVSVVQFRGGRWRMRESLGEWNDAHRAAQRQLAGQIAHRLHTQGQVTWIHPGRIAWYERAGTSTRIADEWLISSGGGLIASVTGTGVQADGMAALAVAGGRNLFGHELCGDLMGLAPVRIGDVKELFAGLFPRGMTYAPHEAVPRRINTLSMRAKRLIVTEASAFARDLRPRRRAGRFEVTAFCEAGELKLIFVVDRRVDGRRRSCWRGLVRDLNVRAALASVAE